MMDPSLPHFFIRTYAFSFLHKCFGYNQFAAFTDDCIHSVFEMDGRHVAQEHAKDNAYELKLNI